MHKGEDATGAIAYFYAVETSLHKRVNRKIEKACGHVVFGNPATKIPVNPKARYPTPVIISSQMNEPSFNAVLTHLVFEKPARRRLPPTFSKSSAPKDTHFVSGVTLSANYYRQITSGKVNTRRSKQSTLQKASSIDQCVLNLLSFSSLHKNSDFLAGLLKAELNK